MTELSNQLDQLDKVTIQDYLEEPRNNPELGKYLKAQLLAHPEGQSLLACIGLSASIISRAPIHLGEDGSSGTPDQKGK